MAREYCLVIIYNVKKFFYFRSNDTSGIYAVTVLWRFYFFADVCNIFIFIIKRGQALTRRREIFQIHMVENFEEKLLQNKLFWRNKIFISQYVSKSIMDIPILWHFDIGYQVFPLTRILNIYEIFKKFKIF